MNDYSTKCIDIMLLPLGGFIGFIVMLFFKLLGMVDISWFWVCFPLWISPAIGLSLVIVGFLISLIVVPFMKDTTGD